MSAATVCMLKIMKERAQSTRRREQRERERLKDAKRRADRQSKAFWQEVSLHDGHN